MYVYIYTYIVLNKLIRISSSSNWFIPACVCVHTYMSVSLLRLSISPRVLGLDSVADP